MTHTRRQSAGGCRGKSPYLSVRGGQSSGPHVREVRPRNPSRRRDGRQHQQGRLKLFVSSLTTPGTYVPGAWAEEALTDATAPPLGTLTADGVTVSQVNAFLDVNMDRRRDAESGARYPGDRVHVAVLREQGVQGARP